MRVQLFAIKLNNDYKKPKLAYTYIEFACQLKLGMRKKEKLQSIYDTIANNCGY